MQPHTGAATCGDLSIIAPARAAQSRNPMHQSDGTDTLLASENRVAALLERGHGLAMIVG